MYFADLHCDTISKLLSDRRAGLETSLRADTTRHIDLLRLQESGSVLQNFALFVPLHGEREPLEEVLTLADLYQSELKKNTDLLTPVLTAADLDTARKSGKIASVLTVEEGGVCRGNPAVLRTLFRLGVRMLTLTWNYPNELGFPNGSEGGLTSVGFSFLEEMEALKMTADVSHLSDEGFWDVCRHAKRPFVASHSACRALWGHRRNLTDAMLRAIGDRGGLVGINFYADFLRNTKMTRTEDIAAHIRHAADKAGMDAVALGSDFDGIDLPLEMGGCEGLSALLPALRKAGFHEGEIETICWKNVWRFYQETLP